MTAQAAARPIMRIKKAKPVGMPPARGLGPKLNGDPAHDGEDDPADEDGDQPAAKTDTQPDQAADRAPDGRLRHMIPSRRRETGRSPPATIGKRRKLASGKLASGLPPLSSKNGSSDRPAQQGAQTAGDRQIEPTGIDDANQQAVADRWARYRGAGPAASRRTRSPGANRDRWCRCGWGSGFVAHESVLRRRLSRVS